ncbi:dihydrofolate reductase family protein [Tomitella biformata]|uniref:dihydrofolate reductase family protein n=1 Tax=Tomitella biformata TaxID=630403 RepID=UPI0004650B18|nr:dihydrofolate reductase family protein [Tomitella biformata]
MAKLIYTGICSIDGYIADPLGEFNWSAPTPQVHAFINDLERPVGACLYGRRLYEVMAVWEDMPLDGLSAEEQDYAQVWRATEKVVFSRTLGHAASARTRIQREFEAEWVRRFVAESPTDVGIGGAQLAGHAIRAGLVDEFQQFIYPVHVGGGKRLLPDGVRFDLELLDERRFDNGVVYLRYSLRR